MKRLLLVMLFLPLFSKAQVYHPLLGDSVSWKVWYHAHFTGLTGIDDYSTGNDTVIGAYTYKKIVYNHNPGSSYNQYFREDSAARKVYSLVMGVDQLTYDFSLGLGDSVYLHWVNGFYGPSSYNGYYKADSISMMNTTAGPRKFMRLTKGGPSNFYWLEGLGVLNEYLNYPTNYCDAYDCGVSNSTFCQYRNGNQTYERLPFYTCDSGLVVTCQASINHAHLDSHYTFSSVVDGIGPYSYFWKFYEVDSQNHYIVLDSSYYPSAHFNVQQGKYYYIHVEITDSGGCQTWAQTFVRDTPVTGNPCNAFFWIYPTAMQGSYTAVDYSTGSNLSYLWDFGDGNTSTQQYPNHQYATSARYTVCLTVSDGAGCSSTYCDSSFYNFNYKVGGGPMSVLNVVSQASVGVDEIDKGGSVRLFPNPANDKLNIASDADVESLVVCGVDGKVVLTVAKPNNTIDVSVLSAGIYVIKLQLKNSLQTLRFIKM